MITPADMGEHRTAGRPVEMTGVFRPFEKGAPFDTTFEGDAVYKHVVDAVDLAGTTLSSE